MIRLKQSGMKMTKFDDNPCCHVNNTNSSTRHSKNLFVLISTKFMWKQITFAKAMYYQ